ncbi:MAG: ATP-grasp domain-containing protein [bacterium]|nr:ATP-grasp domain-containing protein [bacterium]
MSESSTDRRPIALLGYSVETMEAATELDVPFIAVVPEPFVDQLEKDGIPVESWDFGLRNEESGRLAERLSERGASVAVPLYEETVEWAGAVNGVLREDPRSFQRSLLFRDKAMMKRNAQLNGIRVGVFEEIASRDDALQFFRRVNRAMLRTHEDVSDPVHVKPLNAAGSVGHVVIGSEDDVAALPDDAFPCLAESHISGQEFSVEAFVHRGRIRFMNITEYVHLGYSQIVPASPDLDRYRDRIEAAVEKLIRAFQVEYGVIHPEYFVDADGDLNFGEVAARVPGGHIFDLISEAHGFNAYGAYVLCARPETTEEELDRFFPPAPEATRYSANLMVYPRQERVHELDMPSALLEHPCFERHDMFEPATSKVAERIGFGNHYGTIFFSGEDPKVLRELVEHYEEYDFYV